MEMTITTFTPTYINMTVRYTDGLTGDAARESYKGVELRVEYNGGVRTAPGPRPEQKVLFYSGNFEVDYRDAFDFVSAINVNAAAFMASSSVDDYLYDAGYDIDEFAADEVGINSPVLRDAEMASKFAEVFPADLPFLTAPGVGERVVEADEMLAEAWGRIPAEKLRWALANVVATSAYNTDYPSAPLGRADAIDALNALKRLVGAA